MLQHFHAMTTRYLDKEDPLALTLLRWAPDVATCVSDSDGPGQELTRGLFQVRVATKIFEGFGETPFKKLIIGWEPVPTVHFTRPGTCINFHYTRPGSSINGLAQTH